MTSKDYEINVYLNIIHDITMLRAFLNDVTVTATKAPNVRTRVRTYKREAQCEFCIYFREINFFLKSDNFTKKNEIGENFEIMYICVCF